VTTLAEEFDIKAGIKLDGEQEFKSAVTSINSEIKNLKSQTGLLKETFAGQANSLEALKAKHESLSKTLEAQKQKVEATKAGLDNAKESYDKVGTGLDQLKQKHEAAKAKMEEMKKSSDTSSEALAKQEKEVNELAQAIQKGEKSYETAGNRIMDWETKLNTAEAQTIKASRELDKNAAYMKEAEKAADHCATSIDEFGKKTDKAGDSASKMGDTAKDSVNAMAEALIASGVKKSVDEITESLEKCVEASDKFQTSVAKLSTIADETKVPLEKMKNEILELSGDTGKAAEELTESAYQAISASVDTENAVNMVEKANKLAVGGFTDTTTSIDVLTTALNAYGLSAKHTESISDKLVKTQDLGKTSVGELAATIGKVIPVAAAYSVNMDNLSASYAVLTANGVKTRIATTYISAMLGELAKNGSKASKTLKEETGQTFTELMEGGMSLGDVLQILGDKCDGNSTAFANLWSSSQAGVGALALYNAGADKFNGVLSEMQNSLGATEENYKKMTNEAEFADQKMQNSANNLKIAIGEQISPALVEMKKAGTDAFEWATDFVKENPWLVSAVTALTAALGMLVTAFAGFTIVKAITPAIQAFNAALTGNPAVLVATAIVGLTAAVIAFAETMPHAQTEMEKQTEASRALAKETNSLKNSIKESRNAFEENKGSVESNYASLQIMSNKLYDLAKSEDDSTAKKMQMKALVEQLNEAMPELSLAIDEQTGALIGEKEATDACIESMKQKAVMAAMEEELTETIKQQAEAGVLLEKTLIKQQELRDAANEAEEKAAKLSKAYMEMSKAGYENMWTAAEVVAKKFGLTTDEVINADFHIQKLASDSTMLRDETETLNKTIGDQERIVSDCNAQIEEMGNVQESLTEKLGLSKDATEESAMVTEELTEAQKEAAQAAEELADKIKEKYEEARSSIEQSIDGAISAFNEFNGGQEITAEKMLENLQSQLRGLENWKDNMTILAGQAGSGMSREFLDYLIDLGPQGANAVQALVNELGKENGKFEEIAKAYADAMDFKTEASKKLADVQTAFSDSAEGLVLAAKECGMQIPAGLAEGIANGTTTAEDAAAQVNEAISAKAGELSTTMNELGIEIPAELQAGIDAGGSLAIQAIQALNELIAAELEKGNDGFATSGLEWLQQQSAGMESGKGNVVSAAGKAAQAAKAKADSFKGQFMTSGLEWLKQQGQGVSSGSGTVSSAVNSAAQAAVAAAGSHNGEFRSVGYNISAGVRDGINSGRSEVVNAAVRMVTDAAQAAKDKGKIKSPSQLFRDEIGIMLPKGMALGIDAGKKNVVSSITDLCRAAINGTTDELEIQSPSRIFKKLGGYISEGMGIGIKNKAGYAVSISKKMAGDVYKESAAWMEAYKRTHSVSLAEEKKFWKQLAKTVKNDSASYKSAMKNATASDAYIKEWNKKINSAFGVSKTTKKGKETVKKDAKAYYSEVSKAATSYIENQKARNKISLQQEKYYWQQVKKHVNSGSQAYTDAAKKIKKINADIKKETAANKKADKQAKEAAKQFGLSGTGLEQYKTYYKVSAKAEVDYWNIVRQQYKKGTAERIEADQKYFQAQESLKEQQESLNQEYYDNCKEVQDKLTSDIKDLTDAYEDAVKDRAKSIYSSFNLFDRFKSTSASGETLLFNLKTQVAGYADWELQIEELQNKKILSDELLEELKEMGPEASASLHALNSLTGEQLKEYNDLWQQKTDLSNSQAVKDLESMRTETEKQIQELTTTAQQQLNTYKSEYEKAAKELTAAIEKPLKDLASKATTLGEAATAKLISGIKSGATKKSTATELKSVNTTVTNSLGKLPAAGKTIGIDTLQGILDGLVNKKKIKSSATTFINTLKKAMTDAADIHSPSRLFKKDVGFEIPAGVGEGIEEGTADAAKAGTKMISDLLDKSKEQLQRQSATLAAYSENINGGAGIEALNNLTATAPMRQTTVNVDNSSLAGLFGQMMEIMAEYLPYLAERQNLVLDTGTLVGETGADMSHQFAMMSRRLRT